MDGLRYRYTVTETEDDIRSRVRELVSLVGLVEEIRHSFM